MKPFKIRCSQIGRIMGRVGLTEKQEETMYDLRAKMKLTPLQSEKLRELEHRHANPELPEGAKTYVREWFIEQRYGVRREVKSKYLDKGNAAEAAAMERYAGEWAEKNEERFEDEWITGTPDYLPPNSDLVADIKCPFDPYTFPYFEATLPEPDYWWQLQGYMHLTGRPRAELVYCMEDTPARGDWDETVVYDMIPPAERMRIYKVERSDKAIKELIERVKMCRAYAETLETQFLK